MAHGLVAALVGCLLALLLIVSDFQMRTFYLPQLWPAFHGVWLQWLYISVAIVSDGRLVLDGDVIA